MDKQWNEKKNKQTLIKNFFCNNVWKNWRYCTNKVVPHIFFEGGVKGSEKLLLKNWFSQPCFAPLKKVVWRPLNAERKRKTLSFLTIAEKNVCFFFGLKIIIADNECVTTSIFRRMWMNFPNIRPNCVINLKWAVRARHKEGARNVIIFSRRRTPRTGLHSVLRLLISPKSLLTLPSTCWMGVFVFRFVLQCIRPL